MDVHEMNTLLAGLWSVTDGFVVSTMMVSDVDEILPQASLKLIYAYLVPSPQVRVNGEIFVV